MTVTVLASGITGAATTGTTTTASFTPTANALLAAFFSGMDESVGAIASSFTVTDSASLTWTSRAIASNAGGYFHQGRVWTAQVGGSPSSMTVTFGCGSNSHSQRQWVVIEVTDGSGVGAAAGAVTTTANGSYTLTLSGTPASSSVILACVGCDVSGTTAIPFQPVVPGTGWTEIWEAYDATTSPNRHSYGQAQRITGHTSTSVTWNDLRYDDFVTAGVYSTSALAVEITVGSTTSVNVGHASGTGSAHGLSVIGQQAVGHAGGTGAAAAATVVVGPNVGHATGTGAAHAPSALVAPSVGHASGVGAAHVASMRVSQNMGHATGTGAAFDILEIVAPVAGATGTGTAYNPSGTVHQPAGHAAGTGAAYDATGLTSSNLDVNVGHAAGTGAAHDVSEICAYVFAVASGTGAAHNASTLVAQAVGHAAGTGSAYPPGVDAPGLSGWKSNAVVLH